jgi:hypothetical protein
MGNDQQELVVGAGFIRGRRIAMQQKGGWPEITLTSFEGETIVCIQYITD